MWEHEAGLMSAFERRVSNCWIVETYTLEACLRLYTLRNKCTCFSMKNPETLDPNAENTEGSVSWLTYRRLRRRCTEAGQTAPCDPPCLLGVSLRRWVGSCVLALWGVKVLGGGEVVEASLSGSGAAMTVAAEGQTNFSLTKGRKVRGRGHGIDEETRRLMRMRLTRARHIL